MKKLKFLFSTVAVIFFMTAFSNEAMAQTIRYYKPADGSNGKFKVEFTSNHANEKLWFKKTATSEWETRQVTYSDEELIKYKKVVNGKTYIWTLVFSNGNIDNFVLHRPEGTYNGTTIPKTEKYNLVE